MDPEPANFILLTETTNSIDYSTVWGLPVWVCWLIICILLLVSGMFSACENAFSNCNKYHFKAKASKGDLTSKIITKLIDKFDNTLVAVLVGNNIVQTFMSFLSALLFYNLCKQFGLSDGVESILATVVMAALVYVVSDTAPKILSKAIPNRMAYILAWPVYILSFVLYPVIAIFRGILYLVHKMMRIKEESLLSKEDLMHSVDQAINDEEEQEDGEHVEKLFEADEKELVNNVFDFDKRKIKDVYTPFDKVFAVSMEDLTVEKLNQIIVKTNYNRIPIYEDNKDNIVGVLVLKTYFEEYAKDPHLDIRSILEQPVFVKIDANVDDVFDHLNDMKMHLGIVVEDDSNKMIGIVTMEDILEELIDDIDEKPAQSLKWRKI